MIYVSIFLRMYVYNLFIYVCMNLTVMCHWFNYHFGLLVNLPSSLWCIFSCVFPSKLCVYTSFQGTHSFHLRYVGTIHEPSLACCTCHTLSTNKDISLASSYKHDQDDTVQPTVGTPTPNGLRSSWDFLSQRSLDMLAGPTMSTFLVLEGGTDDKLCPLILFLTFTHLSWILSNSHLCDVFHMSNLSTSQGSFLISCLISRMMVKVK